jgi:hypothetical protein
MAEHSTMRRRTARPDSWRVLMSSLGMSERWIPWLDANFCGLSGSGSGVAERSSVCSRCETQQCGTG